MSKGLASWFAVWHPRYRATLIQLMVAAALASCLVYVQNDLLRLLTQTLALGDVGPGEHSGAPVAAPAARPGGTLGVLADVSASLGLALPFLVLALIILVRLVSAAMEYWKTHATGRLSNQGSNDIEAQVLIHLLAKDDAFFARHSPAETVNRLAMDLHRVTQRRWSVTSVWWSVLLLVGNFAFFLTNDWRLAVVALAGCAAGALWTRRMTRHVQSLDSDYLREDDRIKSRFEDFLRAAPEVQVGRLQEKIRQRFAELQADRTRTYFRFVRLNAFLRVGSAVAYLLAFVAMILVVLYMRRAGSASAALALIPVVIWTLPDLFRNASELVFVNLDFQLARTSVRRLLEYEARETEAAAPPTEGAAPHPAGTQPLRMDRVTYRYPGPDGTPQGGVAEVTATFAPGQWTALVGGAGSGKSTVLKLLLGRLKPQEGSILYGEAPLDALSGNQLASMLSLLPQSPVLLDSTIAENLLFGRPAPERDPALTEADLDVAEGVGLGLVCRLKALDMTPRGGAVPPDLSRAIAQLRQRLRDQLRDQCGATLLPYEEGHADLQHWAAECLLGGRCDRDRAIALLLGTAARARLRPLLRTELAAELMAFARGVLRESTQLLGLPNFHVYSQLASTPLDERLWQLRSANVGLAEREPSSPKEALALCVIGLTSAPAELASDERAAAWRRPEAKARLGAEIAHVREFLGDTCVPFDPQQVHPHLTWRENLAFGTVETANSRAGQRLDQTLLQFIEQEGLRATFTRVGLEFAVGRLGMNLSGGQGQLVALSRALLRRTPILVLDEPTSALDPASRNRIAEFLRTWKTDRIVLTVSHDVEFVRQADETKLMDGGRLVASGTFNQLEEGSEVFRRTLRKT